MITPLFAMMAQQSGGQVQEIARTFGIDWPHLTAQLISFGIVCALLYWLAYGPVLRMLDERRGQIAQGLENTRKINEALAGIEAQRQGILTDARTESTRLITEARDIATRVRERDGEHPEHDDQHDWPLRKYFRRHANLAGDRWLRQHCRLQPDGNG